MGAFWAVLSFLDDGKRSSALGVSRDVLAQRQGGGVRGEGIGRIATDWPVADDGKRSVRRWRLRPFLSSWANEERTWRGLVRKGEFGRDARSRLSRRITKWHHFWS